MPLISVVIPTHNRAGVVGRAIESVLSQSFADLELLVVDDGSIDATEAVVSSRADGRVRYLKQAHTGRCAARNAGARAATGRFVTFLDSDDEALPGWLAGFAAETGDPRTGVVCCGVRTICERPHAATRGRVTEKLPRELGPLYDRRRGLFLSGSFALRREIFAALDGFDEALHYAENTDLVHRLLAYLRDEPWEIRCVDRPLVVYHDGRGAGSPDSHRERLEAVERILRRHGARYLRYNRRGYGSWRAVAGVNAARLGERPRARRHFLAAIRAHPLYLRHYLRLALTFVPVPTRSTPRGPA